MGFRIVIINSRCKLETRLNYLVVRGEKEKKDIHQRNQHADRAEYGGFFDRRAPIGISGKQRKNYFLR